MYLTATATATVPSATAPATATVTSRRYAGHTFALPIAVN